MTKSKHQEFADQVAAVAAGRRTFDEAIDLLVAATDGPRAARGLHPLSKEDEQTFRAMLATLMRESLQARGVAVRSPTPHEHVARNWWNDIKADQLKERSHEEPCDLAVAALVVRADRAPSLHATHAAAHASRSCPAAVGGDRGDNGILHGPASGRMRRLHHTLPGRSRAATCVPGRNLCSASTAWANCERCTKQPACSCD